MSNCRKVFIVWATYRRIRHSKFCPSLEVTNMPYVEKNKVRVAMYLDPDVFRQVDSFRNPSMPMSEFYAIVVTEALGIDL